MGFERDVDTLLRHDLGGKSQLMQAAGSESGSSGPESCPVPLQSTPGDGYETVGQPGDLAVRMSALRRLYELIGRLNGGRSLPDVLQSVVDGVVEALGFSVAVVNLVHADGSFEVFAVAGSDDARSELLGSRNPSGAFDAEFAVAEHWGGLRFVPHDRMPEDAITGWIPPADAGPMVEGTDAWHPWDALFAPLTTPSGELVGMLSVDLPHDGRRPGALQRELLEMFATQAGIAIDNARLSEHLRASEASFRLAFDGAAVGMTMTSLDPRDPGRFLRVNGAMCEITGYSASELTTMAFADITHPDDLAASLAALDDAMTGRGMVDRAEKRYIRRDGSHVWVAISSSVIRLESGESLHAITQVEDITARKAAETELTWLVTHDPLTRLLNRAGLHEHLVAALLESQLADTTEAGSAATGSPEIAETLPTGALLYCDLDGFKTVNDTYGHDIGDRVLRVAANRFTEHVRDRDAVARLGGDEFVVVAQRVTLSEAITLAERIVGSLAEPLQVDGITVQVTVSVGIAPLSDVSAAAGPDVAALLHIADTAMYQAKANGRNGHAVRRRADS
jgi:diguanylate cyclase (GGDEF)-like protein/PAS domain S-box-containing protein